MAERVTRLLVEPEWPPNVLDLAVPDEFDFPLADVVLLFVLLARTLQCLTADGEDFFSSEFVVEFFDLEVDLVDFEELRWRDLG